MKISVGILAGSRAQGLNCAKVKAGNRMNISKLIEELDGHGRRLDFCYEKRRL